MSSMARRIFSPFLFFSEDEEDHASKSFSLGSEWTSSTTNEYVGFRLSGSNASPFALREWFRRESRGSIFFLVVFRNEKSVWRKIIRLENEQWNERIDLTRHPFFEHSFKCWTTLHCRQSDCFDVVGTSNEWISLEQTDSNRCQRFSSTSSDVSAKFHFDIESFSLTSSLQSSSRSSSIVSESFLSDDFSIRSFSDFEPRQTRKGIFTDEEIVRRVIDEK